MTAPDSLPGPGPVERAVQEFIDSFPKLTGPQATLAQMALRLSREYDTYADIDMSKLARANMELRQTMTALAAAAQQEENDKDAPHLSTPEWTDRGPNRSSLPASVRDASNS